MLLYEFDPKTGKYLGNHEAQLDTWQTDIKGSPSYIGEANCVWTEPPAQAGFTAYMENGEWVLKANPKLENLKADKLAEIDAWTAAKITGGFVSNASGEAVTYDSDKDTQLTMQGIALNVNTELFAEKYPDGCPVRGYPAGSETKQIYMLTPAQVMQWQADLSIHIGNCKQAGWAKQAEVADAKSKEDLDAIILETKPDIITIL